MYRHSLRILCGISLIALASTYCVGADPASAHANDPVSARLTSADAQRGRLLYETYCNACHTTEAHWRDKHVVKSWADLIYQVTRMQSNAGQSWSAAEIDDVAAYLNGAFYKVPCPTEGCQGPEARVGDRNSVAVRGNP